MSRSKKGTYQVNGSSRNHVAKNAHKFNTSRTFVDRRKAQKAGKVKHKGSQYD